MSAERSVLLLVVFLVLLSLSPGCLSISIGPAVYNGSSLQVQVFDSGGPEDASLQVSVYRFQDFRQVEVAREILPVRLEGGSSTQTVPLALGEGTYRLYLYITIDDVRRASVIQDITVEPHGATPRIGAG